MGVSRVVKIGLVGTGGAARRLHGPAISSVDGVELHGVYGRSLANAEAITKELGGIAYDDIDRMIADDELDALVIATPDGLHAEAAIRAARAGKSVLIEKPMALNSADCEAVIAAFQGSTAKLGMAYRMRFHLGHQEVMQRVHAGEFGALRLVRVHAALLAQDDGTWRNDPKTGAWWVLSKIGTHFLDQIHWAVGRPTSSIQSFSGFMRSRTSQNEAEASGSWSYENGPMAQAFFSNLWGQGDSRIEMYFDRDTITLHGSLGIEGDGEIAINQQPLSYEARPELPAQIEDFAQAIREDRDPLVPGAIGLENVHLLERFSREAEELSA
tara:strand:+ start:89192 stop:90172 length:981 start_codon:yes stop_codon:yes gene_type:complete